MRRVWLSPQTIVVPGSVKPCSGRSHERCLAKVVLIEIFDAELPGILGELFDLNTAFGIVDAMRAIGGGTL